MWFALLLFFAGQTRAILTDEVYEIPPADWRPFEFVVHQLPVRLECAFEVDSNPGAARLVLLTRRDLQQFAANKPYSYIAESGAQQRGGFSLYLRDPGDYAVLVINSAASSRPSRIHLRLVEDFTPKPEPVAVYLSPARRLTVILLSFAAFFAIVTWSARQLLRAMKIP